MNYDYINEKNKIKFFDGFDWKSIEKNYLIDSKLDYYEKLNSIFNGINEDFINYLKEETSFENDLKDFEQEYLN